MNIEDLTKSQLILLTVLVNFVTSVATGILVVALLDTAPPVVTKTINHVVERTVETVAQAAPAATIIQAPKPSVEDLITAAFSADSARAVEFFDPKVGTSTSIAQGVFLPKSKAVVTAYSKTLPKEVFVSFSNGSFLPASLSHQDESLMIYGFADAATFPSIPSVSFVAAKDLKLGQTALALTSDGGAATGIVSKVSDDGVITTLPVSPAGTAAVDLSGNLIGISVGGKNNVFVSADKIKTLLTATSSPPTST